MARHKRTSAWLNISNTPLPRAIRNLLAPHLDSRIQFWWRATYGKMLEAGVKIFEYQPTMIHEKSMVIDGLFSMFGSSNLDARSSEINEELDIVVYDQKFGREMESVFEKDLTQSREYTLEEFKNRTLWDRATEWLMIPFRSQF